MAATRTFTANFVGRTSNLEKSFKRVSKGSSLMSDNLMRTTRMAGLGFAALGGVVIGAAAALKPMIDKAAAMEEALSKNQLLLGESSKAVEAFADTSLESFGVTNLAALQATGVFASLGDAMGMSEEASASMATTLTGLAGDLSSLHDVSVETALTALRAGLIGEAEPLRKLGILLDAATIKSKALAMGLISNTKDALTPAIKSQAAYALILDKGATAMGDFARTADSATNVSKQLAGQWEELQVVIGEQVLPIFTELVTYLSDKVLPAITEFFEDPSWGALGELAGKGVQSGFVRGVGAGLLSAFKNFDILDPVTWFAVLLGGVGEEPERVGGVLAGRVADGYRRAGPPLGPNWDPAAWEEAGDAARAVFYGAAGAMAPGPGFPPFGDPPSGQGMDPGQRGGKPGLPPAGPMVPSPLIPPGSGGGGTTMDPGQRLGAISPTTGMSGLDALALLSDPSADLSRFLPQTGPPGPPVVNITVNAPAVSGQEVVEAIGQYVDGNGPLPPHWQQGAN